MDKWRYISIILSDLIKSSFKMPSLYLMMWFIFKCHRLLFCSTVKPFVWYHTIDWKSKQWSEHFCNTFILHNCFILKRYPKVLNCVASKEFPLSSCCLDYRICLAWNEQWIQITFWINEWCRHNLICDWKLGKFHHVDFDFLKRENSDRCHWCILLVL